MGWAGEGEGRGMVGGVDCVVCVVIVACLGREKMFSRIVWHICHVHRTLLTENLARFKENNSSAARYSVAVVYLNSHLGRMWLVTSTRDD
jgi:hypothetical protein